MSHSSVAAPASISISDALAAASSNVIDVAANVLVRAMAGDVEFEDVLEVS